MPIKHQPLTSHHTPTAERMTNIQRAAFAEKTLFFYAEAKEEEPGLYDTAQTVIGDLVTDLMHLARASGFSFMDILGESERTFTEELVEENPGIAMLDQIPTSARP